MNNVLRHYLSSALAQRWYPTWQFIGIGAKPHTLGGRQVVTGIVAVLDRPSDGVMGGQDPGSFGRRHAALQTFFGSGDGIQT